LTLQASFYSGSKIAKMAQNVFGDVRIEALNRPVSAVAADLITGEKVILNQGLASKAALATSAIPGIFPPIFHADRVLFDGAPVSRVPVDVLEQHRCSLKIAVNVAPKPDSSEQEVKKTLASVFTTFGFRNVWLRSWDVQAYWDGVKETSHADILLEPPVGDYNILNFDLFDELVELGARVATENIESIESAVSLALNAESSNRADSE
jgi:NTE family protein